MNDYFIANFPESLPVNESRIDNVIDMSSVFYCFGTRRRMEIAARDVYFCLALVF